VTDPTGSALHRQSSAKLSTLAARVLQGYIPTQDEMRSLAASVLTQDQTKGQVIGKQKRKSVFVGEFVADDALLSGEKKDG
jgi:hypothetical protein